MDFGDQPTAVGGLCNTYLLLYCAYAWHGAVCMDTAGGGFPWANNCIVQSPEGIQCALSHLVFTAQSQGDSVIRSHTFGEFRAGAHMARFQSLKADRSLVPLNE